MEKFSIEIMKHLEDGGLVNVYWDEQLDMSSVGINEIASIQVFSNHRFFKMLKKPKLVWRRLVLYNGGGNYDDGSEIITNWFSSKEAFSRYWRFSDYNFGPWESRPATEPCND